MSATFDKCKTRPAHIDAILNGLDRYNPETTTVFQDYVTQQCEDRTFDAYANLALLKLSVPIFFFSFFFFLFWLFYPLILSTEPCLLGYFDDDYLFFISQRFLLAPDPL